jgi:hypothetical protein
VTTATSWSDLVRPVLRPGVRVVRRDDRHLQLGLDPPDRLVLSDRPGLLRTLTEAPRRAPAHLRDLLDELVRTGWVVDAVARRRPGSTQGLASFVARVDSQLEPALGRACAAAGLTRDADRGPRLLATVGEPRRSLSDSLLRDDEPHLWLAVSPSSVRLGPFVEPGRTACLRCVDAHLGDLDPRRATVLLQLHEQPAARAPEPDACLVQLAMSWAARDLARVLDGRPSALRSATVTVTSDLEVSRRDWLRHAHCGCAWG